MPSSNWTRAQLEEALGGDVVLLTSRDFTTGNTEEFTWSLLPPGCIQQIVNWMNDRLGGQPPPQ